MQPFGMYAPSANHLGGFEYKLVKEKGHEVRPFSG